MEIQARENSTVTSSSSDTDIGNMMPTNSKIHAANPIESSDTHFSKTEKLTENKNILNKSCSEDFTADCSEVSKNDAGAQLQSIAIEDEEDDDENYLSEEGDEAGSSDCDDSSDDSDFSDFSGISDVSGQDWKPITKPINWVQKQIHSGANPRELLSQMLPTGQIAPELNDITLWRILASMISEPPRRQKLRYVNTFDDVIKLVRQSKNIIVLTGAGVSVSCGIPDFRSSDGIYSRLAKDFPDLPDPQAMFDINYFSRDPRPFYKFAREIYPGQFIPSPCHRFIKLLETKQKLLRNYTQNIDTLEQVAGIKNVIECHGSFSTASCTKCKFKTTADEIRQDIFTQRIPVCPKCQPNVHQSVDTSEPGSESNLKQLVENGIMKPDIVFFGEGLPEEFHTVMASDKDKCDLLIVMGSSLKVRPVALIPSSIPANIPQILINREQLHHLEFDVELLGDSDVIINQLCHKLGEDWTDICFDNTVLSEAKHLKLVSCPLEDETIRNFDTDTQSVKSSTSADIAVQSIGTCSDSGFESSTSRTVTFSDNGFESSTIPYGTTSNNTSISTVAQASTLVEDIDEAEAAAAIKKIKYGMLELNSIANGGDVDDDDNEVTETVNLQLNETASEEQHNFHPFISRLTKKHQEPCKEHNYRHLSIDSSKDSGICDSSNSIPAGLTIVSTCAKLIPINNTDDSGGTNRSNTKEINYKPTEVASTSASTSCATVITRKKQKHQSIADHLIDGTYYRHESSSSYVFPGAQVSWSSDLDEDHFEEDQEPVTQIPCIDNLPPPASLQTSNTDNSCRLLNSSIGDTITASPVSAIKRPLTQLETQLDFNGVSSSSHSSLSNHTLIMPDNDPPTKKRKDITKLSATTPFSAIEEVFSQQL